MTCRSDEDVTLHVTTIMPKGSEQMKLTKTSDLMFLKTLLIFDIWWLLSFMNFIILSPFIGIIICFLDGPLVVIWIQGLGLGLPLMIFWTWSILLTPRDSKAFFILMTSSVWLEGLEACAYDLLPVLLTGACFIFLKNLEIWLTSLDNFTEIKGRSFLILIGTNLYLLVLLLLTMGFTLGVNFDATFCLKVIKLLSA